jgi:4-diphosphocytidyl-2-C-methyl-D-erythritol kinase
MTGDRGDRGGGASGRDGARHPVDAGVAAGRSLPLRALAPAKINLGLFVGAVRADGRHELVSVMQSISLADELTLQEAPGVAAGAAAGGNGGGDGRGDGDGVVCPGVAGPPSQNLAAAALRAFRAATGWSGPWLELRIDKRVPVAAGLGGGSGDAAAALRLAAAAAGREEPELLRRLAGELGADVPAQVSPGRWLSGGAGELLWALPEPRERFGVLVLACARGLSTAAVYAQADRLGGGRTRGELEEARAGLAQALGDGAALPPADLLENDLQQAARELCPEIDVALAQAEGAGADVVLLSGSGPTVLGLFAGPGGAARARAAASGLEDERSSTGAPAPMAAEPVGADFGAVSDGAGRAMRHNAPG